MPKADYTYNYVRSRREIVGLLRHWEPKLRACGSDWESGISGHTRYRILRVANSMLRVLEREYPDSRPPYSRKLGRNSTAGTGHLCINDMPARNDMPAHADTPTALSGAFFRRLVARKPIIATNPPSIRQASSDRHRETSGSLLGSQVSKGSPSVVNSK